MKAACDIVAEDGEDLDVPRRIDHEVYRLSLLGSSYVISQQTIRNDELFHLMGKQEWKSGFGACDDKSYWFNSRKSLRFGHCRIEEMREHFENLLK